MTDLLLAQLTDVFRIGLILALVLTMWRTRAMTGTVIPLLAGVLFVAVIIPATQPTAEPLWRSVAVGLVANAIILGLALAGLALVQRLRK